MRAPQDRPSTRDVAVDDLVAVVHFDPCAEYRALHHGEPCGECGWLAADHDDMAPATVIRVRPAIERSLRRAS